MTKPDNQGTPPVAQLRVGGPVIVKWPITDPPIERIEPDGEFIGIWTEGLKGKLSGTAMFMVLQDHDELQQPGQLVGEVTMPWFGRCKVFRLQIH